MYDRLSSFLVKNFSTWYNVEILDCLDVVPNPYSILNCFFCVYSFVFFCIWNLVGSDLYTILQWLLQIVKCVILWAGKGCCKNCIAFFCHINLIASYHPFIYGMNVCIQPICWIRCCINVWQQELMYNCGFRLCACMWLFLLKIWRHETNKGS